VMVVLKDDHVTVSVVIEDDRGFTYFYDDFVTSRAAAQRALEALAGDGPHPVSRDPLTFRASSQ
jgi:hypothetical protein